jgi:LysR family transcriptional regulator, nod-box dependent transcriptional activator
MMKCSALNNAGASVHLNRFDMNLLVALDTLLREKSVTRAAEKLHVSQPSMSGALQRLREHFEDQLLVRVGREMELTPRAQALLGPVRDILLLTQTALQTLPTFDPKTTKRTFSIVMSDYCVLVFMTKMVRRLAVEAPNVQCNVVDISAAAYSSLESGEVDLCVMPDNVGLFGGTKLDLKTHTAPLFRDRWVCAASIDHPHVNNVLTLQQYLQMPHAVPRFGAGTISLEEDTLRRLSESIIIEATAPSFVSLLFMIPGTRLIATVQERLAKTILPIVPIKLLTPPIDFPELREVLVWHERSEFDPGHMWLRQMFIDVARSL